MAFLEQVEASDTAGTSATLGLQYGDSRRWPPRSPKILKSRDEVRQKGRPTVSLVLADRTHHSLLIYGDPEAIGMARDAVGSLDIPPLPKGKGDVHLISLSTPRPGSGTRSSTRSWAPKRAAGTEDQKPDTVLSKDIKGGGRQVHQQLTWSPPARTDSKPLAASSPSSTWCATGVHPEALIVEVSSEASLLLRHQLGHRRQHRGRRHRRRGQPEQEPFP